MTIVVKMLRPSQLLALFIIGLGGALLWYQMTDRIVQTPSVQTGIPVTAAAEESVPAGSFGVQLRLARDMELSRQRESLENMLQGEVDGDVKDEAEKELWQLTKVETAEHEAETILAAQGWTGAVVTIVGSQINVVVPMPLTENDAASIGRLVSEAAGLDEENVRIVERP